MEYFLKEMLCFFLNSWEIKYFIYKVSSFVLSNFVYKRFWLVLKLYENFADDILKKVCENKNIGVLVYFQFVNAII